MHRKEEKMSSSDYCGVDTGPHAVTHHQYYQMVDLLMQCCLQFMGGLNPHALPYVPVQHHEEVKMNRKPDKKTCRANQEGWKMQKTKKGKRNINNKKHNVK